MSDTHVSLETGSGSTVTDWEAQAAALLRKTGRLGENDPDGAVWNKLTRSTLDGVDIPPLGTPESLPDASDGARPQRNGAWDVRSQIVEPDAAAAAEVVHVDLNNGVTSLWIRLSPGGLSVTDLYQVLDGVLLDVAPVVLDAPSAPVEAARVLAKLAGDAKVDPRSNLGFDPVGAKLRGEVVDPQAPAEVLDIARQLGIGAFVVDGTVVHDRGASDAQELGYVLASAVHYLRAFEAAGIEPATTAQLLEFRLAASAEQFLTIAKFRAIRRLWARVLELSAVPEDSRGMSLHGVTSRPMMSKYDPWVNILRTTVASFAAGVGGADAVTVLPFDDPLGLPDALSRRNARNTSALLIEESHLGKVTDPAGGSYAVERLTDDLASAGWSEFTAIEASGDILDSAEEFLTRVEQLALSRDGEVATRKRPLTGLSEFPNLDETLPQRSVDPAAPYVRRYGHAFESLRDEPAANPVFLATMGSIAQHTARASFASNLLAAGGITTINEGAHADTAAVVTDFSASGAKVTCLVGNDEAYAQSGAELVTALREAGASYVIVAGKVADLGVDDSCAMGVNALEFLTRTREQLS